MPSGLNDPFLPALGRAHELTPIVAAQNHGAAFAMVIAILLPRTQGLFASRASVEDPV